jgi:hypothetical protein
MLAGTPTCNVRIGPLKGLRVRDCVAIVDREPPESQFRQEER